jgi:hypothetical protein
VIYLLFSQWDLVTNDIGIGIQSLGFSNWNSLTLNYVIRDLVTNGSVNGIQPIRIQSFGFIQLGFSHLGLFLGI